MQLYSNEKRDHFMNTRDHEGANSSHLASLQLVDFVFGHTQSVSRATLGRVLWVVSTDEGMSRGRARYDLG